MGVLADKMIVLGVCGGIAAYKAAELVRLLVTRGAKVRVMMTRNAAEFITPLTLQTLSQNPVATDTFDLTQESEIGHIRLADSAYAIVVAPATANVIAKAANGLADDLVTTVLLAAQCPVAFAPAMNVHMYAHPTVIENLARLKARGVTIIEPDEGALACGYEGKGRLTDPPVIVDELERMLSRPDLAAERILITAGPTQEAIDPVRFVSNRSSGKMGFAIATAAWRRGAAVRMVAGPSILPTPRGVERINTVSAAEMLRATSENFPWCSTLIMAAAVADFRPRHPAAQKLKKSAEGLTLELAPIADELPLLAARKDDRLLIGFAAETESLEAHALDKLKRKKLDLIVGNDVTLAGAGFGTDTNIVTIMDAACRLQSLP
ncbi:MAG: bifunctional phosphopantothenoylcysteine decarboxylase/phosphopantothenate--cysteine ligase CoaBC, partial [Candidatus Binataceae bacterium]